MSAGKLGSLDPSQYKNLIQMSHACDFGVVLSRTKDLSRNEQTTMCDICAHLLESPDASDEGTRIGVVKILIASLPYSWNIIERWLKRRRESKAYEVHFSLFCFLDNVPKMSLPHATIRRVLSALADYLHTIDTEAAHAAWMLGDLLGEHWCSAETFAILLDAVCSAQHVAGRSAALSGIERALAQDRMGMSNKEKAIRVLETVSQTDRSHRIRFLATELLRGLGRAH